MMFEERLNDNESNDVSVNDNVHCEVNIGDDVLYSLCHISPLMLDNRVNGHAIDHVYVQNRDIPYP